MDGVDWSRLGANPEAAYEQHRQAVIASLTRMYQADPDACRRATGTYQRTPNIPFPNIGNDVKDRLIELGLIDETPKATS